MNSIRNNTRIKVADVVKTLMSIASMRRFHRFILRHFGDSDFDTDLFYDPHSLASRRLADLSHHIEM